MNRKRKKNKGDDLKKKASPAGFEPARVTPADF